MNSAAAADLADLYRDFSDRLMRIVGGAVEAPDPLIEDACQFAWTRLLDQDDHPQLDNAAGWLITTALHEALKLTRRSRRDASLDTLVEQGGDFACPTADRSPHGLAERRERLRALSSLPPRQQQLLWLYGLGLTYAEIARRQGCTSRTVERQLLHARTVLWEREGGGGEGPRPPTSARLARAAARPAAARGAPARPAAAGAAPSR